MTRRFYSNLSLLFLLNVAVKPVWIFGIDRKMQLIAGSEIYGQYFSALSLSLMLTFLADAGLTSMTARQVAAGATAQERNFLFMKLCLVGFYLLAGLLVALLTVHVERTFFYYLLGLQALTSIFVFLRSLVTGHQFFYQDAWFSVIDKLMMILACTGFMYFPAAWGGIDLLLFLKIQLCCTAFAIIIVLLFLASKKLLPVFHGAFPAKAAWLALIPYALIILLMSLHYRLDGFLLSTLHSAFEAGIYAAAYRLLDAANMAGYLFAAFLVPYFARNLSQTSILQGGVNFSLTLLLTIAAVLIPFMWVYHSWLQQLLYHSNDAYSALILSFCITALPGYFMVHIYGSLLTASGQLYTFIKILLGAVLLNAVINYFLIPYWGALAACFAACCSQYCCGILCALRATAKNSLQFPVALFLKILAFTACSLLTFYVFSKFNGSVYVAGLLVCLLAGGFLWTQSGIFIKNFRFTR